jgi:hypothetical protein
MLRQKIRQPVKHPISVLPIRQILSKDEVENEERGGSNAAADTEKKDKIEARIKRQHYLCCEKP